MLSYPLQSFSFLIDSQWSFTAQQHHKPLLPILNKSKMELNDRQFVLYPSALVFIYLIVVTVSYLK